MIEIESEKNEAGNLQDFELLYSKHYMRVLYFIKNSIGGSYEDAENIAQEAFMIFFEKINSASSGTLSFENEKAALSYVFQIARNLVQNHNRKSSFRKMIDNVYLFFNNRSSAIEKYDEIELRADFDKAVEMLPETYREVLVLKYVGELGIEQISKILDINEGTVKSRFFNGSAKMAKLLREYSEKKVG